MNTTNSHQEEEEAKKQEAATSASTTATLPRNNVSFSTSPPEEHYANNETYIIESMSSGEQEIKSSPSGTSASSSSSSVTSASSGENNIINNINGDESPEAVLQRPTSIRKGTRAYSMTSAKYDRDGKGYLDETEQALRRMDSKNLGYLTVEKMYDVMSSLQQEQKKSSELISQLQKQQKTSLTLKRAVIGLVAFAVLLALANVGTSFAAASLAKDTSVDGVNLVVKGTNLRVGTTPKVVEFEISMEPVDEETGLGLNETTSDVDDGSRRLILIEERKRRMRDICGPIGSNAKCRVQGLIDFEQAKSIHQQFCPQWGLNNPYPSCDGGVSELTLRCARGRSTIYGFPRLLSPPSIDESSVVFPQKRTGYNGLQLVTKGNGLAASDCGQAFTMGLHCPNPSDPNTRPGEPCLVMAAWDSTCPDPVKLCGPGGPI